MCTASDSHGAGGVARAGLVVRGRRESREVAVSQQTMEQAENLSKERRKCLVDSQGPDDPLKTKTLPDKDCILVCLSLSLVTLR